MMQKHSGRMQRLVTAGLLPERAGQPVKVWAHISFADLIALDGSSALQEEWTARVRAQWAAHRAAASAGGSDGGAWLDGDAAEGIACDAAMAPVVTGTSTRPRWTTWSGCASSSTGSATIPAPVTTMPAPAARRQDAPVHDTTRAWEALERAIIGKAADLMSGPGGLASFLRRRQLGARLGGPSLPLDIGYSETIPAGIRNAVILRDKHCQWAGGAASPPRPARSTTSSTRRTAADQRQRLRAAVLLSPPGGDPPVGLDSGPEPRRDDDRVEPR